MYCIVATYTWAHDWCQVINTLHNRPLLFSCTTPTWSQITQIHFLLTFSHKIMGTHTMLVNMINAQKWMEERKRNGCRCYMNEYCASWPLLCTCCIMVRIFVRIWEQKSGFFGNKELSEIRWNVFTLGLHNYSKIFCFFSNITFMASLHKSLRVHPSTSGECAYKCRHKLHMICPSVTKQGWEVITLRMHTVFSVIGRWSSEWFLVGWMVCSGDDQTSKELQRSYWKAYVCCFVSQPDCNIQQPRSIIWNFFDHRDGAPRCLEASKPKCRDSKELLGLIQ